MILFLVDGVFDAKAYTEKAFNKLIKAKAKAERAAAHHTRSSGSVPVSVSNSVASSTVPSKAPTPAPPEDTNMDTATHTNVYYTRAYEAMTMNVDTAATTTTTTDAVKEKEKDTTQVPMTRVELMKSKLALVSKFMRLLMPVLVDVYAASVASQVRTKALVALLKAVSFLDGDDLRAAFKVSCLLSDEVLGVVLNCFFFFFLGGIVCPDCELCWIDIVDARSLDACFIGSSAGGASSDKVTFRI